MTMGDNTFTFTGLLEDEPKKEQVVTTVKVPRFEYARLIAAKAKLDMIEKMVKNMDSYAAYPVLKLLLTEEDADE
jgi:hypothetical protein